MLDVVVGGMLAIVASQRRRARRGEQAGPTFLGVPMRMLRGQHVSTIDVYGLATLPLYTRGLRPDGPVRDVALRAPAGAESAQALIYVNGLEPSFPAVPRCQMVVTMTRTSLSRPLYVGIFLLTRDTPGDHLGTIVLGGWDASSQTGPILVVLGGDPWLDGSS